jgi:L-ascorbate metabolism protein UlaG (beta-lactamase superfamily)
MKILGKRPDGLRLERMRASPLWVVDRFQNAGPVLPDLRDVNAPMPTFRDLMWGGDRREPNAALPFFNPLEAWLRKPDTGFRVTWLGHSTVLLEIGGRRVLIDPVWSTRASPSQFIGPKRFQPVPISIRELPPLDVVVISHDHYDHLDYATVRALATTDVLMVTSLGVGAHLEAWGVRHERIVELDWWESHELYGGDLTITAAPSQHYSGRGLKDRNATLWSSMVIRSLKHAVFYSGDTGLTKTYEEIRARLGPFDLVMLEVGAYHPAWGDIHLGPDNALKAHAMLGGILMPVHWGTFALGMHPWDHPAEKLFELAQTMGVPILMPRLGEVIEVSRIEAAKPWWRETERHR